MLVVLVTGLCYGLLLLLKGGGIFRGSFGCVGFEEGRGRFVGDGLRVLRWGISALRGGMCRLPFDRFVLVE